MSLRKYDWMSYSSPVCDMVHFIKKYEDEGWEFITAVGVDIRVRLVFRKLLETPQAS